MFLALSRGAAFSPSSLASGNVADLPSRRRISADSRRLTSMLVPPTTVRVRCGDHGLTLDHRPLTSPGSLQEPLGSSLQERLLSTTSPSYDSYHCSTPVVEVDGST